MATKSARIKVMMLSTGKNAKGKDTGYFYTTYVNPRNTTDKLELRKLDPRAYNPASGRAGMKVLFKQKKIPK